jgi:hypothetical protein
MHLSPAFSGRVRVVVAGIKAFVAASEARMQ